jgi:hypothetical protein
MLSDTLPEAQAVQLKVYQRMSGARRLSQMFVMSEDARALTLAGLKQQFPQATEAERIQMERRFRLGPALADAAWPVRQVK